MYYFVAFYLNSYVLRWIGIYASSEQFVDTLVHQHEHKYESLSFKLQ